MTPSEVMIGRAKQKCTPHELKPTCTRSTRTTAVLSRQWCVGVAGVWQRGSVAAWQRGLATPGSATPPSGRVHSVTCVRAVIMASIIASAVSGVQQAAMWLLWPAVGCAVALAAFIFVCRRYVFNKRTRTGGNWVSIGFFHPYWCVAARMAVWVGGWSCDMRMAACRAVPTCTMSTAPPPPPTPPLPVAH